MNQTKRKKLEAIGWKFGDAADFLQLSQEEQSYVALKIDLAHALQKARHKRRLTQKELAERLKTSQSRVAMMEKGDISVSTDLLFRSLFSLGATPKLSVKV